MRSANTWAAVGHGLVGDAKLAQVHANHLGQDFDTLENLSVVNTDNRPNHFGHDNHVTQVRLDTARALPWDGLLLGLPQSVDEGLGLALQSTRQTTTGAAGVHGHQFVYSEIKKVIELDSSVRELFEGALLLELGKAL